MKFGSSFSSSPSILLNYKYLVYISVGKGRGGRGWVPPLQRGMNKGGGRYTEIRSVVIHYLYPVY